ncbi:unnamed protein product [Nippostrongylus brasiliensis]|uniref:CABIT domain-containing protein n=1 Tax=Nippostrongylus brasiliensis TaxID=27835 RepID=A0A0N4XLN3_NIPBR|nr:unnamed protein product [Nippostrongylus brasiliensis]
MCSPTHPIHFTRAPTVPTSARSYNIILGNDLLRRLPKWSIDYDVGTLHVGDATIPFAVKTVSLEGAPLRLHGPTQVRSVGTAVLPPGQETWVRCTLDPPCLGDVAMFELEERLTDRSLFVTPVVLTVGERRVLVSNPTHQPVVLYKGQKVGWAYPVCAVPYPDGPPLDSVAREHSQSSVPDRRILNQSRPAFDPSKTALTDAEKQRLLDLFEEFQDRFSYSSYDLGSYHHSEITIKTTTEVPHMKVRPPRVPVRYQQELDRLLKAGRIAESGNVARISRPGIQLPCLY